MIIKRMLGYIKFLRTVDKFSFRKNTIFVKKLSVWMGVRLFRIKELLST